MRILVTGTSGHVGGAVAILLQECGHDVVGVSRSRSSMLPPSIRQCPIDIGACDALKVLLKIGPVDAVVHAAAAIDNTVGITEIMRTNCLGTAQVLEATRKLGATCFLYISSLSVLGKPVLHPVTEEHPLAPPTPYAVSKLTGERLALFVSDSLRTLAFRISSPVGPSLRQGRIFHTFVRNAKGNAPLLVNGTGGRCQDYVDVRDIARVSLRALESDCQGIYNIGSGKAVSNLDLAKKCIATLRSSSEIIMTGKVDPDDEVCWDLSITKAATDLGYRPEFPLERSMLDLSAEIS